VEPIIPILSLLVVLTLGILITRVASVALTLTGVSPDMAKFQARSAYMGVGFTTTESERMLDHPVRRRIIMILMWLGNAGLVATVSSVIPIFVASPEDGEAALLTRLGWLAGGLAVLWFIANSQWIDRQMSRMIEWALRHWTKLEIYDYPGLLRLSSGYSVCEVTIATGDWLAGKPLSELRLSDEGVQVLGIRRVTGEYVGAPTGTTYIRSGDVLIVYGKSEHVAELDNRRAGVGGDRQHEERVAELHKTLILQDSKRLQEVREAAGVLGSDLGDKK